MDLEVVYNKALAKPNPRPNLVSRGQTLDENAMSCKCCGSHILIAHPSWGGCQNKSYMGSGPDSHFSVESLATRD